MDREFELVRAESVEVAVAGRNTQQIAMSNIPVRTQARLDNLAKARAAKAAKKGALA